MVEHNDDYLERLRHSASHVMADAVKRLYPGVKLGIGPAIEDGFYYDFDFSECKKGNIEKIKGEFLTPEDLEKIEKEMSAIIEQNAPFEEETISKEEALQFFSKLKETYKVELLKELKDEKVSLYKHGSFTDLCKGPHITKTGEIKAYKLLALAGAYWRGSEENPMLQRIYGTAFQDKESLEKYLLFREEAQKRDHRKLGNQLDLFSFDSDLVGAGLVLYHPKGAMLRQIISDYITRKHLEKGYEIVSSPQILKSDIWIRSGHYAYYKEHMYIFKIENQEFAVKPMNCPGHILVYASKTRSYKEFPIRYFELGNVYRHEKSGVLHGLLRVRGFTQDDAHIFCLENQVEDEIINVIDFVKETLEVFGFEKFEVELSTRPEKYIGRLEDWDRATSNLKTALEKKHLKYDINEGDGAFYGPKIDIKLKDALGRAWQCATIQCDFALPERFSLKYIDQDGKEKRPIMLHRVILGSLERFIGALVEHYSGAFPLWLAPLQVMIIPIAEAQHEYAKSLEKELKKDKFRVEVDTRNEKMQKKIRDAELVKVPYMVIIGKKEIENGKIAVRERQRGDIGVMDKESFISQMRAQLTLLSVA